MKRTTAILLSLIGLAFVAVSVFVLIEGEASSRSLAIGCIAFFGACALIGLANLLPKKKLKTDPDGAFTMYADAGQSLTLIIGGAGMAIGCFMFAPLAHADGNWLVAVVAWFGAAFFGLSVPVGLWRLLRPKQLARLDHEGVTTFGPTAWSVKWRDVHDVRPFEVHGQRFLALDSNAPPGSKTFAQVSGALGLPYFALSVTGSNVRFEDLEAQARALWAQARAR
jgi:hypothetical protein